MINVYAKSDSTSESEPCLLASFDISSMMLLDPTFTHASQYMILDLLEFDPHNDNLTFFYDKFRETMICNRIPHKNYPKQTFEISIFFERDTKVDITDDVIIGTYDQNELYKLTQNELLTSFKVKHIMKGRLRSLQTEK